MNLQRLFSVEKFVLNIGIKAFCSAYDFSLKILDHLFSESNLPNFSLIILIGIMVVKSISLN